MPPRQFSRYTYSTAFLEVLPDGTATGALILSDPEPFRFRPFRDNRIHNVVDGDSLFSLAFKFFRPLPRPSGLYWIIMDFQPDPIHDPTIRLAKGTRLVIPSVRTVLEEVFSEKRRDEG